MGNGQPVEEAYIGIREGAPCPIMQMKVGVGRRRRDSGVMDAVRVRMYSWQFCSNQKNLAVSFLFLSEGMFREERGRGGGTYTAEKMPNEDYEDASCDAGSGVEILEW